MKAFKNLMIELFNDQKSFLILAGASFIGVFILASLTALITKVLTFQQICYGGLPFLSILTLAFLFLYELDRAYAPFIQNKYRLLSVSATQLYSASMLVSTLIFLAVTLVLSVISYLGLLQNPEFVSKIGAQSQLAFYFKTFSSIIFSVSIVFLTLHVGLQLFNLLIKWISSYLPKSWQLIAQFALALLVLILLPFVIDGIQNATNLHVPNRISLDINSDYSSFVIKADNLIISPSLELFIFEIIYVLISAILSIVILDKFVETEERLNVGERLNLLGTFR